jgi:hypothetical protein
MYVPYTNERCIFRNISRVSQGEEATCDNEQSRLTYKLACREGGFPQGCPFREERASMVFRYVNPKYKDC